MKFQDVLLSPNGRINRQPYWIATLVLFGAGIVAGLIPVVNVIYPLVSIYFYVCVYNKRLHDIGRSGWWQLIAWIGGTVMMIAGAVAMFPVLMTFIESGQDEQDAMAMVMSSGGALALIGLGMLLGLIFHVWLGVVAGQPGSNKYGPNPLNPVDDEVFQ